MLLSAILGSLALLEAAAALSDSHPLVLLSTAKLQHAPDRNQVQTSSRVFQQTREILSTCSTDRYLIVTQPGIHAVDLDLNDGCSMPHLCRAVEDSRVQGLFDVAEVVGKIQHEGLVEYIKSECVKKDKKVTVDEAHLATLSSQDRARSLADNGEPQDTLDVIAQDRVAYVTPDAALASKLEAVTKNDSYTILFLSVPDNSVRDPSAQINLKRDVPAPISAKKSNQTEWKDLPLFEKYQFFTPGIFMGLFVALVLLSILGVGLRALSSLEVSYGAFDKEMGPAAQKKQQ
ncbi:hypothetical protein HIM_04998 [Hirsutella minnesotensis 3608]|uniref:Protein BIG1 n=1 Tax=Hirsutella minnesotensis 3608 TaxID=1043627 RepID=A0A0F7ZPI0_9HYPO|nr:hypothetical protein HIM_04998 [Hirsutella minnesotensis 3608]